MTPRRNSIRKDLRAWGRNTNAILAIMVASLLMLAASILALYHFPKS